MHGTPVDTDRVAQLRAELVARVTAQFERLGWVLAPEVEQALLTVDRHVFTGAASLEEAYGDNAVITKRDERGVSLSSVSAAWLQAAMLGQLRIRPGDRVLEIGSGGYNAALIAELAGLDGQVTTVDIDREVTDRARQCLAEAGYDQVEVICQDAEFPVPGDRTFDKILITVGAWDIPPAWTSQLAEGGRLVVPLRTMGTTRSWVLERRGDALESHGQFTCGFVPMQGAGTSRGTGVALLPGDKVGLWLDEGQRVDTSALDGVLSAPRAAVWSEVTIPEGTSYSDQDLWLAQLPGFCLITADQEAMDSGIVDLPWRYGTPAVTDGPTLAYRATPRPVDGDPGHVEFGVYGHGPQAEQAATLLAEQIRAWDRAGRPDPHLSVFPSGTPDTAVPDGLTVDKRHSRVVISWPTAR
ncbi:methyltransferase, FxLD system [Streptomyces sp. NRRL F-5126]|uniref:methyltransferase, FxLD system n=1 Tax=Streptomyces sp. NRRL F-5126 TaxID=1463857 RepID=UPI00056A7D51|nr:methyltransferase, FxLD system [Streptomyces sp. NRRL F-5126]